MTSTRRAVIYARLSQDRAGAGINVAKQVEDCRELAARLHPPAEVVAVRTDNDLSAFKGGGRSKPRPGYKELLCDLRDHRAEVVLAWHTDRLHRDMAELEEYITVCGEGRGGVPTYTVQGGDLDLSTSNGRMIARILGAVARGEVEHMIERQKNSKERIRKSGLWSGGKRPYGYAVVPMTAEDGTPVMTTKGTIRHTIVEDPREAAELRAMYSKALAGISLHGIARDLNARGVPTAQNTGSWSSSGVRQVLLRASNAGLVEHGQRGGKIGTIVGKGKWPAIVGEDKVMAVRAMFTDPARRTGGRRPGAKALYLLSGIARCGKCGSQRMRVTKNSASPPNRGYGCYDCFGVFRDVGRTDARVEEVILRLLRRPGFAAALNPPADLAALDTRRTKINAELEEIARERLSVRQRAVMSAPLLDELEEIEKEIHAAYRGTALDGIADADEPAAVWAKAKADGNVEVMRGIVKALVEVTILPIRYGKIPGVTMGISRGEQPRGTWFHPESVRIEPRQPA